MCILSKFEVAVGGFHENPKKKKKKNLIILPKSRDGNFAPPHPASPRAGFPRPAKVMGRGWGKILDPHHGAGRGWIYTF